MNHASSRAGGPAGDAWIPGTAAAAAVALAVLWIVGALPFPGPEVGADGPGEGVVAAVGETAAATGGPLSSTTGGGSIQPAGVEPASPAAGESSASARASAVLPDRLDGFRPDAWYLPDEPLLGFVQIPEGPFLMGSDPATDPLAYDIERWSPSRARATVGVPTYYIGRFEVTVAQYAAFVEATGHPVSEEALSAPPDHPVAHVTWPDGLAYARWLEGRLRRSARAPEEIGSLLAEGWRVTLPSEPEWEKAARGTDGRIFPWGNRPRPDRANFQVGGATRGTTPVGSFSCPECPYGLADMSGNVWEWTRSPYQPYPYDEADDDENLRANALWVIRGGSFQDPVRNVRAAVRGGGDPGARRAFVGFRVVIAPPP